MTPVAVTLLLLLLTFPPSSWCYDCLRPNKDAVIPWGDDVTTTHTILWQLDTVCFMDVECYGFDTGYNMSEYVQLCPLRVQSGDIVHLIPSSDGDIYHMRPTNVSWENWISCPTKDYPESQKLYRENQTSPIIVHPEFLQPGQTYLAQSENGVFSDCKYGLRIVITIMSHDCRVDQSQAEMCSGHGVCGARLVDENYRCFCDGGYKGRYCADVDGCYDVVCYNNGSCVDLPPETVLETGRQYSCLCADGFLGTSCSLVQGQCTDAICMNNGTCNPHNDELFSCICSPGYTGSFCEIDIDECLSSPCYGFASCIDSVDSFNCICDEKYTGELCDVLTYDPCLPNPCHNNGNCSYVLSGETHCDCPEEFTGELCEVLLDVCYSSPCFNGGTCVESSVDSRRFSCICAQYLTGAFCEQLTDDPCEPDPCENVGRCTRSNGGFHCDCPPTASGPTCSLIIEDPCHVDLCQNGASCLATEDGFICVCLFGFHGDRCEEKSRTMCGPNPCRNGGYCVLSPSGQAQCQCSPGWMSGMCQSLQNMCLNTPCNNGTVCLDTSTPRDPGTYLCVCPHGYQGENCEIEINECESNPCHQGTCVDGIGGYNCSCPPGYNGTHCELDIDACQGEGREVCLNGATCIDSTIGMEFSCTCTPGFTDVNCSTNIDECESSPCLNDAQCVDGNNGYHCLCATGYQGNHCEEEIDHCLSEPCLNNATCTSTLPGAVCQCAPGFTNKLCNVDIDDCVSRPCLNGGFCMDGINSFWCVCFARFTGTFCETPLPPPCGSNPCYNNATCQENLNSNTFTCICADGFEGEMCENEIDYCHENDCQNNATCVNTRTGYECLCPPGYTGDICWTEVDECDPSPCVNGVCQDRLNGYECFCPNGYQGRNCSLNVDECTLGFCHHDNTASCVDGVATYTCVCKPGYTGALCVVDIDECLGHGCLNGASCVDKINGYVCECSLAYRGQFCESDIDECSSSPCQQGSCVDQLGSHICVCPDNGRIHDSSCNILPPCTADPCQNNATCVDDFELYRAICSCVDGFDGDFCELDRDECLHYDVNCQNGGTCVDLFNNFTCQCAEGFDGDLCEIDLNACRSPDVLCENNSSCVDAANGYTCACAAGYKGIFCGDIAESCSDQPCINGATCSDKINDESGNNFTCSCHVGYTGVLCEQNIDDCIAGVCGNGTCIDGVAAYDCVCPEGFTGVECEVNIDDCVDNQCTGGSTCLDGVGEYTCTCPAGITGTLCEVAIDECFSDPCQNSGLCVDHHNGYSCYCRNGFTGTTCGENYNECASAPCLYGGTCIDDVAGYVCQCVDGFTDADCSVNIDECVSSPCLNAANCTDLVAGYRCDCVLGFSGDNCQVNIDECGSFPCLNGGLCRDLIGAYICDCPQPYRGENCQYLPCDLNPCGERGLCTNDLFALPLGFQCQCFDGFTGSRCQLSIDDCRTANGSAPCSGHGYCADGQNSYMCYCAPGWKGKDCERPVDECPEAECRNNATCVNRVSGYICECLDGYAGQFCERESDECDSIPCDNNSTCIDLFFNYTCRCAVGWSGRGCDLEINECSLTTDSPCNNGGTCVDMVAHYSCLCPPFYTGVYCDVTFDPCWDDYNQCENNAACETFDNGTYACSCPNGFIGKNCERNEDDCASAPCQHESRCEDLLMDYRCHCQSGYTGHDCDVNIDDCVPGICRNNGTCIDLVNNYRCNCSDTGFEGDHCTIDLDECLDEPCLNNGKCRNTEGGYSCLCSLMYSGEHCETKIDPCGSAPCQNNALCTESGATYVCFCKLGYTGQECHININDCTPGICQHGRCEDLVNDYLCRCEAGWSGPNCSVNINECMSDPCFHSGQCLDNVYHYTCLCPEGYSGLHCEIDLYVCVNPVTNASLCRNAATCLEGPGDQFNCLCTEGYSGVYCEEDNDECTSYPCRNNATCSNGINRYDCICSDGWTGLTCDVDIQECTSKPCVNGGMCQELTPGLGYECVCRSGFGGVNCEVNYDDCSPAPRCLYGGTCIDGVDTYTCLCVAGTSGENCEQNTAMATILPTPQPTSVQTTTIQSSLVSMTDISSTLFSSMTGTITMTTGEIVAMATDYISKATTDYLFTTVETSSFHESVVETVIKTHSFGVGNSVSDLFTVHSTIQPMKSVFSSSDMLSSAQSKNFDFDLASNVVSDMSSNTLDVVLTMLSEQSGPTTRITPTVTDINIASLISTDQVTMATVSMSTTEVSDSFPQTSLYSTYLPKLVSTHVLGTEELSAELNTWSLSHGPKSSLVAMETTMMPMATDYVSLATTLKTDHATLAATTFVSAATQTPYPEMTSLRSSADSVGPQFVSDFSAIESSVFKTREQSVFMSSQDALETIAVIYSLEPSKIFTLEPSKTFALEPSKTFTLEPSKTFSMEPSTTFTLEPSKTFALDPSKSFALEPSMTFTLEPSKTFSIEPFSTFTLETSKTFTLEPSKSFTLELSKTFTLEPSKTFPMEPSTTFTLEPPKSFSMEPSTTMEPSNTYALEPSQTYAVEPSKVSTTPVISNLYTTLISPDSTIKSTDVSIFPSTLKPSTTDRIDDTFQGSALYPSTVINGASETIQVSILPSLHSDLDQLSSLGAQSSRSLGISPDSTLGHSIEPTILPSLHSDLDPLSSWGAQSSRFSSLGISFDSTPDYSIEPTAGLPTTSAASTKLSTALVSVTTIDGVSDLSGYSTYMTSPEMSSNVMATDIVKTQIFETLAVSQTPEATISATGVDSVFVEPRTTYLPKSTLETTSGSFTESFESKLMDKAISIFLESTLQPTVDSMYSSPLFSSMFDGIYPSISKSFVSDFSVIVTSVLKTLEQSVLVSSHDAMETLSVIYSLEPSQIFTAEQSKTFSLEPSKTILIEPSNTISIEPSKTILIEPSYSFSMEPSDTILIEQSNSILIEPSKTILIEPSKSFSMEPSKTYLMEPSKTYLMEPSLTMEPSQTFTLGSSYIFTLEPSKSFTIEQSSTFHVEPSETLSLKPSTTFIAETSTYLVEPSKTFLLEGSTFSMESSRIFSVEPSNTILVEFSKATSVIYSMELSKSVTMEPSMAFSMEPTVILSDTTGVKSTSLPDGFPDSSRLISELSYVEKTQVMPSDISTRYISDIVATSQMDISTSYFGTSSQMDISASYIGTSSQMDISASYFGTSSQMDISASYFGTSSQMDISASYIGTSSQTDISTMYFGTSSQMDISASYFGTSSQMDISASYFGTSSQMDISASYFGTSSQMDISASYFGTSSQMDISTSYFGTSSQTDISASYFGTSSQMDIPTSYFGTTFQMDISTIYLSDLRSTSHMDSSSLMPHSEITTPSLFTETVHPSEVMAASSLPAGTNYLSYSTIYSGTLEDSLLLSRTESPYISDTILYPSTMATNSYTTMTSDILAMETVLASLATDMVTTGMETTQSHIATTTTKDFVSSYLSSSMGNLVTGTITPTLTTAISVTSTILPTPSSTISPTATIITSPVTMTTPPPPINCSGVFCYNGGVCLEHAESDQRFICDCHVGFYGDYCEQEHDYVSVFYNGTSYLEFGPPSMVSHNVIEVTFSTSEMFGLLLYSSKDYTVMDSTHFVHLFIEDGFLKYQFSCIAESFVLDSGLFVSTGEEFNVTIIQYEGCRASLSVDGALNHTHIELGMNFVFEALRLNVLDDLYVGGLPNDLTYLPPVDLFNFTGCVGPVLWNGELFGLQSALNGENVAECPQPDQPITEQPQTTTPPGEQSTTMPPLPLTCANVTCNNDGICRDVMVNELLQYECDCPLHYGGQTCDQEIAVHFASFNGDSYLQHHDLDLSSGAGDLYMTFKTSSPNGTLLYANAWDGNFIHLYIEEAMLRYQLTCGATNVLELDTQIDVSHGNLTEVTISHQINRAERECQVSIKVDSSEPLVATLVTSKPPTPPILGPIYLGGLPHDYIAQSRASPLVGYVGCIRELAVNGEEIMVFADAVSGRNIKDCDVEPCLYEPCLNNGSCLVDGEGWYCSCRPGYSGPQCERDTCDYNPCLHGSTCLFTIATWSHVCLCPYGRHGVTCDEVLTVTRPQFAGSIQGYSSYMAYPMVKNLDFDLEIRFNFTLDRLSDGLMLYAGHRGNEPGQGSDFILIGIQQGYLIYRYDLGSGMADIRSMQPINASMTQHSVLVGRTKQYGWLLLDNQVKVTGRSRGKLVGLNVHSQLYIGGLDFFIKQDLPKGVDFESGFSGCIYNLGLRVGRRGRWYSMQGVPVMSGRNVQQCGVAECLLHECYNGGKCVDLGASFRCDCPSGYKGPLCADTETPYDGPHDCAHGAVCVPQPQGGYQCHCALGQYGTHCEQNITITDPKFVGESSYMAFTRPPGLRRHLDIQIEFRPLVTDGLLLYIAEYLSEMTSDFLSIELSDNHVNLRYNTGTAQATVVRSNNKLASDMAWHTLRVGRNLTHGYVVLDGIKTESPAQHGLVSLDVTTLLYLGGLPDLSLVTPSAVQNEPITFEGCVRDLVINGYQLQLTEDGAVEGLNIEDCDGTPCGHRVCHNQGECVTQAGGRTNCTCTQDFHGSYCEESIYCLDNECAAGSTCLPQPTTQNYTCLCPIGTHGIHCIQNISLAAAQFNKQTSHIVVDRSTDLNNKNTYMAFNMSTIHQEALLVWTGKVYSDVEDYMGVGISEGRLKVIVSLGWWSHGTIVSDTQVNDGQWHQVIVIRDGKRLSVHLDADVYVIVIDGDYINLDTDGLYYIGGFGAVSSVQDTTRGIFHKTFSGCLSGLQFSAEWPINLSSTNGADIESCDNR